jgi:hypothetical protein
MAITIEKVGTGYLAKVTPPHGNSSNWKADRPMSREQLIQQLISLGCHQTDIGDAFYDANSEWLNSDKITN